MFDATDRRFMKKALALGEKGLGQASPNPSVGCLIIQDEKVVGRGWHIYELLDHAEVRALREAGEMARNAVAYVTLEPCCHQGRTPPCTDRLIQSGVRRVVVARRDPNPSVSGKGIDSLRAAGIRVDAGIFSDEAGKLIEPFACHITTGRPLVISKVGMSLDGKIGTGRSEGRWITSPEGRAFGQHLRLRTDAILVGVDTILTDNPELTYRGKELKSRPILRVILDSNLRTPPNARMFESHSSGPVLLFCRHDAPDSKRRQLENAGAEILEVPCAGAGLDLRAVLQELGNRNILGVLVEGGSEVHWSFISENLVDVFYFIIAPLVLGGRNSVPAVGGTGYAATADSSKFRIRKTFSVGPDIVLEAYPAGSKSIISPWLVPESAASGAQDSRTASRRK